MGQETPHRSFPKPQKQEKPRNISSFGRRKKEKKELSPLKQKIFADHKSGKGSAGRAEFPPSVVDELKEESEGICRECLCNPATTTHHVLPRGRKGRGVKTNGLRLCGGCHDIIQTTPELLQKWIDIFRERHGEYFWFDEEDWNEHGRKQATQQAIEREKEERLKQIAPVADLIATAAGRTLRAPEIRLLDSMDSKELHIFTGLFTDALNGYAAQRNYRPNDRFED